MSDDIKVSIIVPVHNGEQFLKETMDCIVGQTLKEIEILCVDDESTDSSLDILRDYQEQDSRITIFENRKSNAGAARNYAMDRAQGKYLLFWDCDDLFTPEAAEHLYNQMEKDHADIGVCDADHYDTQRNVFIWKPQYLNKTRLPETIPFSRETNSKYIFNFSSQVAWNKMFRKSFVSSNGIRFQEIPRINDHYFVSVCMVMADCITIVDEILVHYRVNQTNSLTNKTSDTPLCKYDVQCDVKRKLLELDLLKNEGIMQSFVNKSLNTMIHGLNIQNSLEGFCQLYRKLKTEGLEYLELRDYGEDYFYNPLEYRNLLLLLKLEYDEYLFEKGRDYRSNIEEKGILFNQYKRKAKELEEIKKRKWYRMINKILPVYSKLIGK